MNRFVLDASVALAWFVDNPISPAAARVRRFLLQGYRAVVPALWHLEMANGLAMAERRGILPAAAVDQSLVLIEDLLAQSIETEADIPPLREVLTTARNFQLSTYDAMYLDTARRERIPLATLDAHLRTAATRAGVELLR